VPLTTDMRKTFDGRQQDSIAKLGGRAYPCTKMEKKEGSSKGA
jgi:hypothetical protein